MDLSGRLVLVLGLGESGLAMARWCAREGARVRVADTRDAPPMKDALDASIDARFGPFDASLVDGVDLVAISPGLAPSAEPQRTLLVAARERGVDVVSEIELFAWKLGALKEARGHDPRVVAITGTNGKTTVTRLVGRMVEAAGRRVAVAGNVSPSALDALTAALDAAALPDVWVLELSSFQLETTRSLAAHAATVLNVTQDHLDWHGTMDAYVRAKRAVFASGTVRVLNRDDRTVMAMRADDAPRVGFGLDAPVEAGDVGVERERAGTDALAWLVVAEGNDPEREARGRVAKPAVKGRRVARPVEHADDGPVVTRRLMPVAALGIRGDHNVANVLAALALGRAIGLPMAAMLRAAAAYRGEPHRMQPVATVDGVAYVEDSKGTNVGATVAGLSGLGAPVVLIAGGDGKGQDFAPLAAAVIRHARAVVLIGRDRGAIRSAVAAQGAGTVALVDAPSLEAAVVEASRRAEPGDTVLLSPACASLDMFRDYRHRADVFVAAVRALESSPVAEAAPC